MSPPIPYGVRALALSHARAWPTAAWTSGATALAAGLALSPVEWAALAGLTVLCATTIRMIAVQLVNAWLALQPDSPSLPLTSAASDSEYDRVTYRALRAIA